MQFFTSPFSFCHFLASSCKRETNGGMKWSMSLKSSVSSPQPLDFSHLITRHKTRFRPSLEYWSYVWGGASLSTLSLHDKVQSKALRLVNNPNLTEYLQPLSYRRLVPNLSIFYRYFHGHCSHEIRDVTVFLLPSEAFQELQKLHLISNHLQVSLPNPRTLSHKS